MMHADLPIESLTAAYDVGDWRAVERIPGGKNQHYRLTTGVEDYVLRRSQLQRHPDSLAHEHALIDYLRRRGFPAPQVVRTADGPSFACIDGRLYTLFVFVWGARYDANRSAHLAECARSLARYHAIVRDYRPQSNGASPDTLASALERRAATFAEFVDRVPAAEPQLPAFRDLQAMAGAVIGPLNALYAGLPQLTIHGGCRRGSMIFDGDRLAAVLDFDSAHREARALDLAVALHDFAKIYGDSASPDYKVALDPAVIARFVAAYCETESLAPAEIEALPLLMRAKRIKRAMGKTLKYLRAGDVPPNEGKKLHMELRRLRWLDEHDATLKEAIAGGVAAPPTTKSPA